LIRKDEMYQLSLYGDCKHKFVVRFDLADRKKRYAKESTYSRSFGGLMSALRIKDTYYKVTD